MSRAGGLAGMMFSLLVAGGLGAAAPPAGSDRFPSLFTGTVSDSECGLDHSRMKKQHHLPSDLVCTRECCEKYRQEYVLADHAGGDVYQLDDQKAARRFANRVVRVLGELDAQSGTIRVVRIEPVR